MCDGSAAVLLVDGRAVHATTTSLAPDATMTGFDDGSVPLRIWGGRNAPLRDTRPNDTRRTPSTISSQARAAPPSGVSVNCGCPGFVTPAVGTRARGENVLPSRDVA